MVCRHGAQVSSYACTCTDITNGSQLSSPQSGPLPLLCPIRTDITNGSQLSSPEPGPLPLLCPVCIDITNGSQLSSPEPGLLPLLCPIRTGITNGSQLSFPEPRPLPLLCPVHTDITNGSQLSSPQPGPLHPCALSADALFAKRNPQSFLLALNTHDPKQFSCLCGLNVNIFSGLCSCYRGFLCSFTG